MSSENSTQTILIPNKDTISKIIEEGSLRLDPTEQIEGEAWKNFVKECSTKGNISGDIQCSEYAQKGELSFPDECYFGEIMCGGYEFKGNMYNPDYRIGRLVKHMQKKEMKKILERRGQIPPTMKEMQVTLINTSIAYVPDYTLLRIAKRFDIKGDIFSVKRALYEYTL